MKKIFALLLSVAMVTSLFAGVAFAAIPVTGVTLTPSAVSVNVGADTQLTAAIAPTNATTQAVTWASSAPLVATVSPTGLVRGVAAGQAIITVTTTDGGFTAAALVTVNNVPVTGITLPATATVSETGTITLVPTITPTNATNRAVVWSSSALLVATVDPVTGVVTGVLAGHALITATTVDGSFAASTLVTVTPRVPVTSVTVTPGTATRAVDQTQQFVATVLPATASQPTISWSSSDPLIATVDAAGEVTAVAAGTAIIRATSVDGPVGAALITVTAAVPVATVTIAPLVAPNNFVRVGTTRTLTATVLPANATSPAVTWTPNNPAIATVSAAGVVSGVSVGTVNITATAGGVPSAALSINITAIPTGVTINAAPLTTALTVGTTATLVAAVAPAAAHQAVTWSSSAPTVATVDAAGVVTAVAAGTAVVTATSVDGGLTATRTVTVPPITVTGVTVSPALTNIPVTGTVQLNPTVAPNNATNRNVTWVSANTAVATVSTTGLVTGVAAGQANIIVTTIDGNFSAVSVVHVTAQPPVPVTGISVAPLTASLVAGATQQLTTTILPATATNQAVVWASTNSLVATVSATGLVTAVAPGVANITVTTADGGFVATSVITVTPVAVTGVAVVPATASVQVGATQQLVSTIAPANATNQAVVWASGNAAVATVNATTGLVTAVAPGTATITVITVDGGRTATSVITVPAVPVSGIALSPAVTSVVVGATQPLVATVLPAAATNRAVTFLSTNTAIATVNAFGVVTGVAAGQASIIATTVDGGHAAISTVHVLPAPVVPVASVSVAPLTAALVVGGTQQLVATVLPANATNPAVAWSSSNSAIATVNASGLVTAVAAGTANITVTTVDGNRTATSVITVTTVPVHATSNSITAFTIPGALSTQIVEATNQVIVVVPAGFMMPVGGVVSTFTHNGASVVQSGPITAFNTPVMLTITSQAGVARVWQVQVTRPWFLNATVTGDVSFERTAVLSGRVSLAGETGRIPDKHVSLQRRAPHSTEWVNVTTPILTGGVWELIGGFNFTHTFTAAGDYRLAIVTGPSIAAPALRIAGAEVVQAVGTVSAFPLTISVPATSIAWNDLNQITVPVTVIRQAVGGLPVNLTATPVPAGMLQGNFNVRYNGAIIEPVTTVVDAATGVTSFTFTRPAAALMTGTLVIGVADMSAQWSGQITINLVPRVPFNASTRIVGGSLTSGATVQLETTVFTAGGGDIAPNQYTMTTITGPIAATVRMRTDADPLTPVGQTARTAELRILAPGTFTITTVLFDRPDPVTGRGGHHELGRVVETMVVRGGLVVNLTTARVGNNPVNLSATVTDLSGNPVNNALVTFTANNATFVERSALTGVFPTNPTIADATTVVSVDGSRPIPRAGHAVNNGVYTAEVLMLDVATVDVTVRRLLPQGPPWFHEASPWISFPGALVISPRLSLTATPNMTRFVTEHAETLSFTVRDAAGNLVAEQLTITTSGGTFAPAMMSPGVWSGVFTATAPGTYTITGVGLGVNRVNSFEFTVTVENPRVVINTSTSLVTADFFEVITVQLFDPRLDNNVPISLPLQVREGRSMTPDRAWRPTAQLTVQTRANATAPWVTAPTTRLATGIGAAMHLGVTAQPIDTFTEVMNFAPATVHEFRVLTWSRQLEIAGVEQAATLRLMASHTGAAEHFVQTLTPATITPSATEVRAGVANRVTLTLRNAHGVAFGTIPQQGAGAAIIAEVPREVIASGRWAHAFNMPESGVADLVINVPATGDGLIAGNIRLDVFSDRQAMVVNNLVVPHIALRTEVRVVAPLDTVAPVIEVVAPATVTTATAQITVTVTDDNMIAREGVSFNGVWFEMNAVPTFNFVRNVDLALGANTFLVSATDRAGNVTNRTITITRTAPAAADTAAPIIEVTVPAVTTEATAVVTLSLIHI